MKLQNKRTGSKTLSFEDNRRCLILFGQRNENLKAVENQLKIDVASRGNEVSLQGEEQAVRIAENLLTQLYDLLEQQQELRPQDVITAIGTLERNPSLRLSTFFKGNAIKTGTAKKSIVPKTPAQKVYLDTIATHDLVFSIGPAGTGKTYLAMAMAVNHLLRKDCKRIVLTRPAVEAGERLGFLPGDIAEKVNPYLRPLYDALYDMVELDRVQQWFQQGVVEVAPLAFMRGRTLNDSFIILDEAQNTTQDQMKMFLTRMGFGSKAVVTGDITQIDLPDNSPSGLIHATRILNNIEGIGICRFTEVDVVRHPLVQRIVLAYDGNWKSGHGE